MSNRSTKRTVMLCVLCFLLAIVLSSSVSAADGFKKRNYTFSPASRCGYSSSGLSIASDIPTGSVLKNKTAIPSKYDSRDKGIVTKVKNQGDYGACWAFSTASVAETSLINEYGAYTNSLDLSELQLAYFTFNAPNDPLGLTGGDKMKINGYSFLDVGGNLYISTMILAKWIGVADESVAPYKGASNKTVLDKSLAYGKNMAVLENAYWIPMNEHSKIKEYIMRYGSCGVSYCHNDLYLNKSTGAYYSPLTSVASMLGQYTANHSVTIVGWDDNYSVKNFNQGILKTGQPRNDGAWLVKLSYGKDFGKNGYIWISYEEMSLFEDAAVFFDFMPAGTYQKNYQYDGSASMFTYYADNDIAMANVFKAEDDEILKAVSFYTIEENVTAECQIYINPKSGKPESGTAVFAKPVDCSQITAGYHTVKLPQNVSLCRGDSFSVVIKLHKNGKEVSALCDSTGYLDAGGTIASISESEKGQSFLSLKGGKWKDLYSKDDHENLRIKAFTTEGTIKPKSVKLSLDSSSVTVGKSKTFFTETLPLGAVGKYKWKVSDENIAEVSDSGKITGKAVGTVTVKCINLIDSSVKASMKVKIVPKGVEGITQKSCTQSTVTVKWKAVKGADGYKVYGYDTKRKKFVALGTTEKTSYKLSGLSQGTTKKIKVSAYIKKGKTTYMSDESKTFSAKTAPGAPSVRVASTGKKSVSLKWSSVKGASYYRVYKYNLKTKKFTLYKKLSSCKCTVSGLSAGKKYSFRVKSFVTVGSSEFDGKVSKTVSAVTRKK